MGILPASLLALIYTLSLTNPAIAQSSSSGTYTLGNDITIFIPSCARSCFISFLDADFPKSTCGTTPSLDCLCTHNSTSGFTAGEVALECLVAENNVGFCEGETANSTVLDKAYHMCVGKPNALPNTHSTVAATVIIETSKPSIVQVAQTPSSSTLATSTWKASSSVVSTAPPTTANSTTTPTSLTTTSTAPTVVSSALDTSASTAAEAQLSSPQIAGIVVAGVGAVALAIGAIAIAAFLRRRRRREREKEKHSGLLPFQLDPSRGQGEFFNLRSEKTTGAPGPTRDGIAKKITPPVPPRVFTDPFMFSRRSLRPDEIDVAVSPETKKPNRSSRLLPEKPVLRLHVPPEPMSRKPPPSFPIASNDNTNATNQQRYDPNRESSMTQFEEDTTPYTPYNYATTQEKYHYPNQAKKYVSPLTAMAVTYDWQNPPTQVRISPQDRIGPLEVHRPIQNFSQPLQPDTAISSVYSGRGSLPGGDAGNRYPSAQQEQWQQQQQYKPYMSYPKGSEESTDTVTDVDAQGGTPPEPALVPAPLRRKSYTTDRKSMELSPVAESPVSYPKIPELSPTFIYPPPKQPNFQLQRERDSQPWLQAERNAATIRSIAQQRQREKEEEYAASYSITPQPTQIRRSGSGLSTKSSSSSLLEKRRGKEQADALMLKTAGDNARNTKNVGWRVVPGNGHGKEPEWKSQKGIRFNDLQGQGDAAPMSPSPWELTPKKMGDDLFLTVR